jgi:PadR family transcriptional regulator PadR
MVDIEANNQKSAVNRRKKSFHSPGVLEMCVLSLLNQNDYYGYKLSKDMGLDISESTLYPILRRLENRNLLTSYQDTKNSKLRKVYSITPEGSNQYQCLKYEWKAFTEIVDNLLER